ncbi:MAG: tRNA (adenosine(37)-N6)-threonylcarbamoyltransferase complex dimerization subunit type 1 TsaB [Terriglobales bacterium]
MLILAIDTAHKNGSITLAQTDNHSFQLLQTLPVDGGAFSAQLVPRIAQLLADNGFNKSSIDAYVACVGPGSFTGLRIGLSGIKGLAEVLPRPIAAVSSLEALAAAAGFATNAQRPSPSDSSQNAPGPDILLALLDAGRSEFYAGEYRREGHHLTRISEALCTPDELKRLLKQGSTAIASQSTVADFVLAAGANCITVPEVDSARIAEVGWRKLLAGDTISADALDANYLRRDDSLFTK